MQPLIINHLSFGTARIVPQWSPELQYHELNKITRAVMLTHGISCQGFWNDLSTYLPNKNLSDYRVFAIIHVYLLVHYDELLTVCYLKNAAYCSGLHQLSSRGAVPHHRHHLGCNQLHSHLPYWADRGRKPTILKRLIMCILILWGTWEE